MNKPINSYQSFKTPYGARVVLSAGTAGFAADNHPRCRTISFINEGALLQDHAGTVFALYCLEHIIALLALDPVDLKND